MLTPASSDPNRKAELARKKKDPAAFGGQNASGQTRSGPQAKEPAKKEPAK